MTIDDSSRPHDPIAWLLMFVYEAQHQQAALRDPATASTAFHFFQTQLPRYRQVLEQALFPLLKRRLRDDDDDEEEELRRAIFIASGTALNLVELLPDLVSSAPAETTAAHRLAAAFNKGLEQHLEKMQAVILPAVPIRLGKCDMSLLTHTLEHQDAPDSTTPASGTTTHSQEYPHDAR